MDIAYYISELLGQIGEVNVPGLGVFAQSRLGGYYDDQEATFYPPGHKIDFGQQYTDDDVLAKYIARTKNISLASSKYFTEKYITSLKNEAMLKDVPLADLGWLHMEESTLIFTPAEALANTPSFYGLPPVKLEKTGSTAYVGPAAEPTSDPEHEQPAPIIFPQTVVPENAVPDPALYETISPAVAAEADIEATHEPEPHITPAVHEPVKDEIIVTRPMLPALVYVPEPPAVVIPSPVYTPAAMVHEPELLPGTEPLTDTQEEFIFRGRSFEGDKKKRNWWGIMFIGLGIIIMLMLLGLVALYKFKPNTFNRLTGIMPKPVEAIQPPKTDTIKKVIPLVIADTDRNDTTKKIVSPDTATETVPASIDTFARVRYEISGGAFKTLELAKKSMANYKKLGFEAKILRHSTGKLYKLTLGTYFTKAAALAAEQNILNSGKVSKSTIGIQPYNPNINSK